MEFNWDYGKMEESISGLEATRKNISEFTETLKETLKNDLLSAGMQGAVADALAETSIKEVDEAVETFLINFDSFTTACRNANAQMEELETANIATASM